MTTAVPKYSRRRKFDPVQPFLVILCILVCIITIYPMYYVLIMSISDPAEVSPRCGYDPSQGFLPGQL